MMKKTAITKIRVFIIGLILLCLGQGHAWAAGPPAPTNLSGTFYTLYGKVTLSWTASPGADYYIIHRAAQSNRYDSIIASHVTATTYDDTSADPGVAYYYQVEAVGGGFIGGISNYGNGASASTPPVENVLASQGALFNKVNISFDKRPEVSYYHLFRFFSHEEFLSLFPNRYAHEAVAYSRVSVIDTCTNNGTCQSRGLTDTTGTPGTHYFYAVVGYSGNSFGLSSDAVEGWAKVFATTAGVTATQGSHYGEAAITWAANPDAVSYDLYRSAVSGTQGSPITSNVTATTYDDTTVVAGTHYFYTVIAKNGAASAPASNQAEGWGAALAAVINVNATQGTLFGSSKISFTYNPSASGYDIYRSTTADSQGSAIGTVCGGNTVACQMYNDTTVSGATHYFYTVVAKNSSGGTSPPSSQVEGWGKVFAATVGVTATQGTAYGKSTVSWTTNTDAVNYDLYRSTTSGAQGSIVATNLATTSYDDTTVVGSTHYFYTVVA
ncbi:MAG: hypothetical protein Q7U57_08035, partial [Methylovulum sp.]|nr:hypothetical protein [Methylovulum sp.]